MPNKAPEPTTMSVTPRAPSSTSRAGHSRGSSLTLAQKLKSVVLLLFVCFAAVARGVESRVDYSTDEDVRALADVKLFAFDIVALSGRSHGEVVLSRLLK